MAKASITRSRFFMVYAGLALLFVATALGCLTVVTNVVIPKIIVSRAETIERIVRTNFKALEVNDHRAVRDELLRSGFLGDDRDFSILRPSREQDRAKLAGALEKCLQVTAQTCVKGDDLLLFSTSTRPLLDHASFVVELRNTKLDRGLGITPWAAGGMLSLALLFLFIAIGIRSQEKFFIKKLSLLTSTTQKFGELLRTPGQSSEDEFDAVSQSIEQLASSLEKKTEQVENYRSWLARKTRREQLELTLRHSAHDLRAPLEETAEFCKHMPLLLEKTSKDAVLASVASLEKRVRAGLHSLDTALRSTVVISGESSPVILGHVFEDLLQRRSQYRELANFKIVLDASPSVLDSLVNSASGGLSTAFWNIVMNAFQARRDGQLSVSARKLGNSVQIFFKDNGPGIPDAMLGDVFLEFVTTKSTGTGIGLSSARRTIEAMGGTLIALPSGTGALIQATIPVIDAEASSAEVGGHA